MKNKEVSWRNPWRGELERLLSAMPASRPPALRRSLRADWLFAADLPRCAEEPVCQSFMTQASLQGWETAEAEGWIQIRRRDASPPESLFPDAVTGEAACVLELIQRHPGRADDRDITISLMKAREEGPAAFEEACRRLHQELARRLRTGEDFPRLLPMRGAEKKGP